MFSLKCKTDEYSWVWYPVAPTYHTHPCFQMHAVLLTIDLFKKKKGILGCLTIPTLILCVDLRILLPKKKILITVFLWRG